MTENLPEVQAKARGLRDYMNNNQIKDQLAVAMPKWLSVDRFLRIVFGALLRNPRLMDCSKESLLQSVMACAQLGLEPILGRAYLIPYNNSKNIAGKWVKVWEVQMQVGYQGFIDLVRRSGEIANISSNVVFENDKYTLDLSLDRVPHEPFLLGDRGDPVFAYTAWTFKDGNRGFDFMTIDQIYKRRNQSPAWQRAEKNPNDKNAQATPWVQWPEEMIKKTAIKNHTKMLPMTIDFMDAVQIDNKSEFGAGNLLTASDDPGATTLTLPQTTEAIPEDFDREFADIMADKDFPKFFELARDGNIENGVKPTDDEVKLLALNDKRGLSAFRDAFAHFKKVQPPGKPKPKTKTKATAKKSASGASKDAKAGAKAKAKVKDRDKEAASEFDALQQSDDWQNMSVIFEDNPGLYRKYNGKHVKTFDDAAEFLKLVYADPEYKDAMPGA